MSAGGGPDPALRVAIVGAGPSGFYTAEALIESGVAVRIDLFERLPCPFGLVRSGVAPDHPKLKQAIAVYEQIAARPEVRLRGNVTLGRDLGVDELLAAYHAVVLACGAETDRRLGIPGEDLPGSHAATEFVGWYNGHPDHRDRVFDLSHPCAVVIGQGNVALDVCRILAKPVEALAATDIAAHALAALATSRVREIHLIGRRGPAQVKFSHSELRELAALEGCAVIVDPGELELEPASRAELAARANRAVAKSYQVLEECAARAPAQGPGRRIYVRFRASPVALEGERRLARVVLARNRLEGEPGRQVARPTGQRDTLECGLLLRSVGYRALPIPGVPFDAARGVVPSRDGRVLDGRQPVPGLYAVGWLKRGATGIIGTNRADAVATVESIVADRERLAARPAPDPAGIDATLARHGVREVSYPEWQRIDAAEVGRGARAGKPREKLTRIGEMLAVLDGEAQG